MDELSVANKRRKVARDEHDRDYEETIRAQDEWEGRLQEHMSQFIAKKKETAEANGNIDAADEDLVEVNAGGKIVVARRSTLTQMQGSKFEAIFSGCWDKKLLRDSHGRIFLDVNPICFQAIVDHLNEMTISSEDSPPSPPSVDDEHKYLLRCQLECFGFELIEPDVEMPESIIIKNKSHCKILHDWLKEDDSDGDLTLLYRRSIHGSEGQHFHSKCDDKGCTLTIIETTCGAIFGGYSNTPWSSNRSNRGCKAANKAFLFVLSAGIISSPCKMKLKDANDPKAIYNNSSFGPVFGGVRNESDFVVSDERLHLNLGRSYHTGPLVANEGYEFAEMEVYQVTGSLPLASIAVSSLQQAQDRDLNVEPVTRFSADVNEAINAMQACLLRAEADMRALEESFNYEQTFIEKFASGDTKDVITLNVSGTMMVTTRSTLCTIKDSVLAQQFNDSKWTEQGYNGPPVSAWTPLQVSTWAKNVEGLPEEVSDLLYENEITGRELLAMNIDSLKVMGMKRIGTVALLLHEISSLKRTSRDFVTLIEHSPYCFGKILDYLRLKRLHSLGLLMNEPVLPQVCDSQKDRFEKVVKYYFPGDAAKSILEHRCVPIISPPL
jgi:hypothetical protein